MPVGLQNGRNQGAGPKEALSPAKMIAFLGDPESYPHRPREVRIVQTHISYVALAGEFVFKVKKPVNLGFADFSTLERRYHFTSREVELNRRFCPDLYLGVERIVLCDGRPAFDMSGSLPPIDFAVKMRRLDDRFLLRSILEAGGAENEHVDRFVEYLAPLYRTLPRLQGDDSPGRPDILRQIVMENLEEALPFVGKLIHRGTYRAVHRYCERSLVSMESLLAGRVQEGFVRDGHGDLRPDHVYLGQDRVCVFDCLEFSDRLRCCDIASDAAFFSMELSFAGRRDLSLRFVERFSGGLKDPAMHGLLPFYECHRAVVRGKVESIAQAQREIPAEERDRLAGRAKRYFQFALSRAVSGSSPLLLAVMGRVASGKSMLAALLGECLGRAVFSSDVMRKELAGLPLTGRPSRDVRERIYTPEMSARTYDRMISAACDKAQSEGGAIFDATFGLKRYRDRLFAAAESVGAEVMFVEVTAEPAAIHRRLGEREGRTDLTTDARLEDSQRLSKAYEAPLDLDDRRLLRVRSDDAPEAVVEQILIGLVERNG
jgi:aminoglycoside phosphotransferase family enzyme/predicted kinase